MRVWHYTIFSFIVGIINDGEIIPTGTLSEHIDIPGVWLSTNPLWEKTVWKALRDIDTGEIIPEMPKDDLIEWGIIPVRIEIDPMDVPVYSWEDHKRITAMPKVFSEPLEKTGRERGGNPKEWYVSYEGIPSKIWYDPIEIWTGKEWDDIETLFTKDKRRSNHHLLDKTVRRKPPASQ
jgi:hypothetical protein